MQTVVPISPEVCPPVNDEPAVAYIDYETEHDGAKVAYKKFFPLDETAKGTILLAPGYLGIQPSYEGFGASVARQGWNIMIPRMIRRHNLMNTIHHKHIFDPLLLSSQALWAVIKDQRQMFNDSNIDMLSHSMGGPTTMKLLDAKPNAVRSVLLVGSAGLDHHSLFSLATKLPGVAKEVVQSIPKLEIDRRRTAKHIAHYIFEDLVKTGSEALAVAGSNIHDSIARAMANGVMVGREQFAEDPFFPLSNITDEEKQAVDLYRVYPNLKAGHLELILNPGPAAKFSVQMIQEMNTK